MTSLRPAETVIKNSPCGPQNLMRRSLYSWSMGASPLRVGLLIGLLAGACPVLWSAPATNSTTGWRFPDLRFRVPLTVQSGLYPRQDCLVRWSLAPGTLLQAAGVAGLIATNSFHVVAQDRLAEIAHLFVPGADETGELRWLMPGQVDLLSTRRFWVYFNAGNGPDSANTSGTTVPAADLGALLPDEPSNLVRNPGFEITDPNRLGMPAEWFPQIIGDSKGRLELVEHPRRSGRRALKLEGLSGEQFGVRQDHIPLKPDTLYRIGVWARAEAANTNELMCLQLLALLRTAAGEPIRLQRASMDAALAIPSDAWAHVQKRGLMAYQSHVRTTPDTAFCNLRIYLWNDATREISMRGIVYLDDVEVNEVRPQDTIPPVKVEVGRVELRSPTGS